MHPCRTLASAGFVALLCFSQVSRGETLTHPGNAPCGGTLQVCIDDAAAGDTVELATNGSITEDLETAKSLTLRVGVGAYEFAAVGRLFYTDRETFLAATNATAASFPYSPGTTSSTQSGQIVLEAVDPSTLSFGAWPANFPNDNDVELALNDKEDLNIFYIGGLTYAMGIDFDDASGGSTPSTFDVIVKTGSVQLASFQFQTQRNPDQNYIGVWASEPFDRLEIRETTTANENEFFGTVSISLTPLPRVIFEDGFEPAP